MSLHKKIRDPIYIKTFGIGEMGPHELLSLLKATKDKMLNNEQRCGHLIYPMKPRELEVRKVMCDVLGDNNFNYMIECPIHSTFQKSKNRVSFVDLSIFLGNGIVDIEFKQSPSDIARDFPKLLSPCSIGCASFYIFNGKNIDKQLPLIISRFHEAYETAKSIKVDFMPCLSKWYLFYLLAFEEKRAFYQIFYNFEQFILTPLSTQDSLP
jgi:hypothetical protein